MAGHSIHELPRLVLGDDCEECRHRAERIEYLAELDETNLGKLAWLARERRIMKGAGEWAGIREGVSDADMRAMENLRLAARIVFTSGISWEDAR